MDRLNLTPEYYSMNPSFVKPSFKDYIRWNPEVHIRSHQLSVVSETVRDIFLANSGGKLRFLFVGGRSGFLGKTGVLSLLPSLTGRGGCGCKIQVVKKRYTMPFNTVCSFSCKTLFLWRCTTNIMKGLCSKNSC